MIVGYLWYPTSALGKVADETMIKIQSGRWVRGGVLEMEHCGILRLRAWLTLISIWCASSYQHNISWEQPHCSNNNTIAQYYKPNHIVLSPQNCLKCQTRWLYQDLKCLTLQLNFAFNIKESYLVKLLSNFYPVCHISESFMVNSTCYCYLV